MRCSEISILLATRRDLSAAEESTVRAHLDDCSSCAAQWSREERTSRVLRALPLPPVKQPPAWVDEEVQAMIQHRLLPRWRWRWRYGLALAGAALGSLTIFLLFTILSNIAPRLSPLEGTYQPGPLGMFQADPQLRPAPDAQATPYLYVINESIYGSPPDREKIATVFEPVSGKKLLVLNNVEDVLLAPDGSRLYATVPGFVLALDPQTHRTLWKVALEYDLYLYRGAPTTPPSRFAISPDGRLLYVFLGEDMSQGGYLLRAIDTQTAQLLPEIIALPDSYTGDDCGNPQILTPSADDSIYLVCLASLYKATITADQVEKIETPGRIADAVLSADGRKIYALSYNSHIYVIDAATETIERATPIDPIDRALLTFERGRLALSGDGSLLAIGDSLENGDQMLLLDTRTWQTVRQFRLDYKIENYMMYLNADGSRVYLAITDPKTRPLDYPYLNTIAEIDSASGEIVKTSRFRERQFWKVIKVP